MNERYTEKQWDEEMALGIACGRHTQPFGTCNLVCPSCGAHGFYGPRQAPPQGPITRKYRACKFCGFWQEAWGDVWDDKVRKGEDPGKPYRCNMIKCEDCNVYNWKTPWAKELGPCENCHGVSVKLVKWPNEDSTHPFCIIKNKIDQVHSIN